MFRGVLRLAGDRLENRGQQVGLRLIPDKHRELRSVGVVENDGLEAVAFQHEQFELVERGALGQCILELTWAEEPAVDSHDSSAGASRALSPAMPGTMFVIWPSLLNIRPSECWAEMPPRARSMLCSGGLRAYSRR